MRGLLRKVGLSLVALALAGAYVLSGGEVAHADPTTVDGARAQLAQLEQQQSELDAKYTEVQVKLQDSQKTLDEARSDAAAQQTKVTTLKTQVSQIALQQYRSSGLDTTTQLLVTDDVQSFLNGLSTIKKANDNTASLLQDYQSAQADLADLQRSTEAETQQIAAQEASLADLKKQSDDKVNAAQALLDKLTAAQRQQLAAQQAAANQQAATATDTSRSAVRTAIAVGPGGSARAIAALNFALAQVGKSYVRGGTGPNSYDCSGLTMTAFAQAGDRPAPHVPGTVRRGHPGESVPAGAWRPRVLLLRHQPRRHLHRQRHDRPRGQPAQWRPDRFGDLDAVHGWPSRRLI